MQDLAAGRGGAAPSSEPIERFGYRQELKRSLGLFDLVVYGLVFIDVIAPFAVFGVVYNTSRGMVPLVYIVGVIAMVFTALSYMTMSRVFPIAGSVYSYARFAISEGAGFFAGWALLLDYLFLPALAYVVCAIAIESVVPGVPRFVWIILVLSLNTVTNLLGIETAARFNRVILALQFTVLGLFLILSVLAVSDGVAGARFSLAPLFQPSEISLGLIFGGLSLAVLSFLGFDAISVFTEEVRGGTRVVGQATLISLCLAGFFFVAQTYMASLFVLGQTRFAPGQPTDAAFYTVAGIVGGPWFMVAAASLRVLVVGLGSALAAQAATARLLYSMARDGKLPRLLAHVDTKSQVPRRAILLVAVVTLMLGLVFAAQLELLTSMVNFGALTGFLLLHLSVIVHFVWRQGSREWLRHLAVPFVGFVIVAYVLFNMAPQAKVVGLAWLMVGALVIVSLRLSHRAPSPPL
jgi:amino acid transporter